MPNAVKCGDCRRLFEPDQLTDQPPRCPDCWVAIRVGARSDRVVCAFPPRSKDLPVPQFCSDLPDFRDVTWTGYSVRREIAGLGHLWLVFALNGCVLSFFLLQGLKSGAPDDGYELVLFLTFSLGLSSIAGLVIAVYTLMERMWAVHAGLVMSYFWAVGIVLIAFFFGPCALILIVLVLPLLAGAIISAHAVIHSRQQHVTIY